MSFVVTQKVLIEVGEERARQDQKWGEQNHLPHSSLAILAEEFGEAAKAVVKLHEEPDNIAQWFANLREELIQTAAVAVQFVECLDRNYGTGH